MEIRKVLHERPAVTVSVVVVLLAIAGFFAYASSKPKATGKQWSGNVWYTADEGKTWSPESPQKITPYTDGSGKTWVRAYVFSCKDGKPFCGYIEMYPPTARSRMGEPDTLLAIVDVMETYRPYLVVKKPGDANWVPKVQAQAITDVMCPGTSEKAKEVLPD
jgi:hypothetical protein